MTVNPEPLLDLDAVQHAAYNESDRELLAHARSDVLALVAELRAARGALQAVRDLRETATGLYVPGVMQPQLWLAGTRQSQEGSETR